MGCTWAPAAVARDKPFPSGPKTLTQFVRVRPPPSRAFLRPASAEALQVCWASFSQLAMSAHVSRSAPLRSSFSEEKRYERKGCLFRSPSSPCSGLVGRSASDVSTEQTYYLHRERRALSCTYVGRTHRRAREVSNLNMLWCPEQMHPSSGTRIEGIPRSLRKFSPLNLNARQD